VLFSRVDCGLCEEMLIALRSLPAAQGIGIDVVDVDALPEARERYGHKIPVLTMAGELVCRGRLDIDEVHKALAAQR
jgi:hypothetical protein